METTQEFEDLKVPIKQLSQGNVLAIFKLEEYIRYSALLSSEETSKLDTAIRQLEWAGQTLGSALRKARLNKLSSIHGIGAARSAILQPLLEP